jgi:hypothetical protein
MVNDGRDTFVCDDDEIIGGQRYSMTVINQDYGQYMCDSPFRKA